MQHAIELEAKELEVKELEANGFLSNLRAEAPLSNLPVLGNSH